MTAPREIQVAVSVIADPMVPSVWRWKASFNSLAGHGMEYGADGRGRAWRSAWDWVDQVYRLDHAIDDKRLQDEPTADRCVRCALPAAECRCNR